MLIHCDYCGSAFDPEKNATCPHCGASWATDAEAERVRQAQEQKARAEQNAASTEEFLKTAEAIRRTVGTVGNATGGFIRFARIIAAIVFILAISVFLILFLRFFFF